jgi:hypothetical protein
MARNIERRATFELKMYAHSLQFQTVSIPDKSGQWFLFRKFKISKKIDRVPIIKSILDLMFLKFDYLDFQLSSNNFNMFAVSIAPIYFFLTLVRLY